MTKDQDVRVLVVTIDTEEEGRWSSSYPADGHTCENILRLDRVQRIFEKLGVIPTYLVDHPVVVDQRAREVIRDYARRERAEIGAHLHPWCNPPFSAVHARTPDPTYPHLFRIVYPDGWTSTPANLSRAKDAAYGHARYLLGQETPSEATYTGERKAA